MIASANLTHDDTLSPEAVAILRAGAADYLGYCCSPGRVVKNFAAISEAEKRGYIRFLGERPWITDAGRRAIGAPTEAQADYARRVALLRSYKRPRLKPEKREDPRTDFDYRSYKACGYVCTLVMKQPDGRYNPLTVRVGKTLTSDPQFLGANNSIVLEAHGRFLLAVMPDWLIKRAGFSTYPLALDPDDSEFTDAERETWERLRMTAYSVNARIRSAGRRQVEKLRFGENA